MRPGSDVPAIHESCCRCVKQLTTCQTAACSEAGGREESELLKLIPESSPSPTPSFQFLLLTRYCLLHICKHFNPVEPLLGHFCNKLPLLSIPLFLYESRTAASSFLIGSQVLYIKDLLISDHLQQVTYRFYLDFFPLFNTSMNTSFDTWLFYWFIIKPSLTGNMLLKHVIILIFILCLTHFVCFVQHFTLFKSQLLILLPPTLYFSFSPCSHVELLVLFPFPA